MSTDQLNRVTHPPNSSIEQCAICFDDLINQKIGIPEHCEHNFCFSCLVDWTKEKNSCPNDRQIFQYIFKKHSISSHRPYAKVDINDIQSEIYLEEEGISCHVCDDEDQEYHPLLTCAQCRNSYHEFCLNSFDASTWMCPSCGYNHEEITESVDNPPMIRRARRQIKTSGLRDEGKKLRIARPLRRLQHIIPQNSTRRIENSITRNPPSSRSTIHAQKTHEKNSSVRSVITPTEAARRIAASGQPILSCPRSTALISQEQNMAALQLKRKLFARLPPRIPVNQLPRIQRRTDAPFRPCSRATTQKSNPRASASFIDKLLHSQKQLHSLENIQMQGIKPHPMTNELFQSEQNSSSRNDPSLSLNLSLRLNNHQSNLAILSNTNYKTSIHDRNRIYGMRPEEISFSEEYKQNLMKFTTPNNPFLSEISSNKSDNKDQPIEITTSCPPSLTLSLARKPYNTLNKTEHLLSNDNHSITVSTNDRSPLDEHRSTLRKSRLSQWFARQISDESSTVTNSSINEIDTNVPSNIEMNDSIQISADKLEKIKQRIDRYKLQREIVKIAKKTIKPAYKKHYITKDDYKRIMKKVVTKATYSNQLDQKWFDKKIHSYVKKCRTV